MTQPAQQPKDYSFPEVAVEHDGNLVVLVQRGPNITHTITLDAEDQERVLDAILSRPKQQ